MIEAASALIIALIAFAIGYGTMKEKVISQKALSDERYLHLLKEIDMLKDSHLTLSQIKISIAEIVKDIHYIKEKL
jgi:hypothetical protein